MCAEKRVDFGTHSIGLHSSMQMIREYQEGAKYPWEVGERQLNRVRFI